MSSYDYEINLDVTLDAVPSGPIGEPLLIQLNLIVARPNERAHPFWMVLLSEGIYLLDNGTIQSGTCFPRKTKISRGKT